MSHIPSRKRASVRAMPIGDECGDWLGVVRYDEDPDVFTALAWALGIERGWSCSVQPPVPAWYRCNPDSSGEYAWLLAPVEQPGNGVFTGAVIRQGRWFPPEELSEATR